LILGDAPAEDLLTDFLQQHGIMPIIGNAGGKPIDVPVELPTVVLLNLDMLRSK